MLRVLALDDDNHSCMFVTEYGATYHDACEFIKYLAKPHMDPIEVRGFSVIDPGKPLMDLEDDVIDDLFYYVEGVGCSDTVANIPYSKAFDMLWNSSKERWRS